MKLIDRLSVWAHRANVKPSPRSRLVTLAVALGLYTPVAVLVTVHLDRPVWPTLLAIAIAAPVAYLVLWLLDRGYLWLLGRRK